MKTLIFLLFICSLMRFNLFAEGPIGEAREAGGGLLVTNSAGKVYRLIPVDYNPFAPDSKTNKISIDPKYIKEPISTAGNQTNALKQSIFDRIDAAAKECARDKTNRNSDIPKWEDSVPVEDFATNSTNPYVDILDIPPPITNDFNLIFPKLYTIDNYLVMTNAQYSGRNRRILSFTQFTSTGCESLYFDVTKIHPTILKYLNLTKDRVIREDKEMTRIQLRNATNKLNVHRRKLEGQIRAMEMMDATDQLDAIDSANDTIDIIHNTMDAMDPTLKKMMATDMDEDAAINIIKAALDSRNVATDSTIIALDKMRGIIKEIKKESAEMEKQRELIRHQEFWRSIREQNLIKQSRPKSMEVHTTEEYIDGWGNIRTVPKSTIVDFNYDQ